MEPGRYSLPNNPIGLPPGLQTALIERGKPFNDRMRWAGSLSGFGDIVPGGYPLPQNPVGNLPKSPDITQDMLDLIPDDYSECGGAGMGCGCASCSGMGDIAVPSWAMSLPSPLNGSLMGFPTVYVGLAVIGLYFFLGKKGRR